MIEIVLIIIGLLFGYGFVLIVEFSSRTYIQLFPQILNLTFWQAMVTHYNLTWLWFKHPRLTFWVILLFSPIYFLVKLLTVPPKND